MSSYIPQNEGVQLEPNQQQPTGWAAWLPSPQQMLNAVQLRFGSTPTLTIPSIPTPSMPAPETDLSRGPESMPADLSALPEINSAPTLAAPDIIAPDIEVAAESAISTTAINHVPDRHVLDLSMRQGVGLVCLAALIAGFIPFVWNWMQAASLGTALPLVQAMQAWAQPATTANPHSVGGIISETTQILAGLPPRGPAGLAAFLSALGEWLNWPMRWLAVWIVYGLGVLMMSLLLGATATLQRFYAVTSYAAIPLLLGGLAFIPVLGWLVGLVALVWAVVIYFHAVRTITGLDTLRVVMSMMAPVAMGALAVMLWTMIMMNVIWRVLL